MIRPFALLCAGTAILLASPALAQDRPMQGMDHSSLPGMKMPAGQTAAKKPAKKTKVPVRRKTPPRAAPAKPAMAPDMQGMDHSAMPGMASPQSTPVEKNAGPAMDHGAMPGMDMSNGAKTPPGPAMPGMDMSDEHAGHDMSTMPGIQMTGTALPAGNAPAPKPPTDRYADRQFPAAEMARSHMEMMREQGGLPFYQIMFNVAEYQFRKGQDGYRWDGEAWYGGDVNRLTLKSEGEGVLGGRSGSFMETAEVQALYSRAIDPYWNLQAGIRYDFKPNPSRAYATVSIEGLAPYWFETEAAVFLSNKGELLGRIEGYYDQRITQRLILQPRVELNLSAQDVPETRIGAGISNAEFGLRLRYEIDRQFAPYIGISYDRRLGRTADFARMDGDSVQATSFVVGLRTWF